FGRTAGAHRIRGSGRRQFPSAARSGAGTRSHCSGCIFRYDALDRQRSAFVSRYDFLVIGSGIAGLTFAIKAAQHGSVALITKRERGQSNTAWAQGGIACVTSTEDSFELHVQDTLAAGAGLCDESVVRSIVT